MPHQCPQSPHQENGVVVDTGWNLGFLHLKQWKTVCVTAETQHQPGRLVGCNGERDVPAQGLGQAQL